METQIEVMTEHEIDPDAVRRAGAIIKNGGLVAFPTETVYGLGGNAFDPEAARKIYAAKGRPSDNPLIVHIAELTDLPRVAAEVPEEAVLLAEKFWPGPLTMILKKTPDLPKETTGGLDTVAVRFPSDRIAQALIRAAGGFVAAPSANLSGRPSTTRAEHVIRDMNGRIDMILCGGDCEIGLESTIVDLTEKEPVILRPGYYSLAMLREVLPQVKADPGRPGETDLPPKAPGMKYRHYAPKADLVLVEGETAEVTERINAAVKEAEASGIKTAVICAEETKDLYHCGYVFALGSIGKEEELAHRLFDVLRQTDDLQIERIYSEAFDTPKLGKAIMNRLSKAAGRIVHTDKKGGRINDSTGV